MIARENKFLQSTAPVVKAAKVFREGNTVQKEQSI
jgi:hypothetical protein